MVAITIGMLLMLGLGTVFVSVAQTSKLRQSMSVVQDNERTAIMFLNNSIRGAGYFPNPITPLVFSTAVTQFPPYTPATGGSFTTAGQSIVGTGTGTGSPGTDTLSVRFVASTGGVPASQGCSAPLIAGDLYTDVFSVATAGPNAGYLNCQETDNNTGLVANVNLVPNLAGMNIVYGVDPGCTGSVTEYLPANTVPASVWGGSCTTGAQLKTVNITLQFNNPLVGQPGQLLPTVTINQTIPYMIGL